MPRLPRAAKPMHADLRLAVPDARLDRPVLRGRAIIRTARSGCGPARKIPHILRADLALLLKRPEAEIDVIRMEAAGCYGRNCADDVSADAVLLSRAVGRPVRVQLTREQEHAWEPKGTAQLMDVNGGLNADGSVAGYDFATRYPSNGAPTLALLLTGHDCADPCRVRDGRPHRDPALRLRQYARGRARHAADRARLVVSRRLGAAQYVRA